MFFVCIALAVRATGRDEAFTLDEKLVYLFMAFVNVALYGIVSVVEYMTKPTKH